MTHLPVKETLLVTLAIIKKSHYNDFSPDSPHNEEYLIAQRAEHKHNGLRWEFPGGTMEPGEDPRLCLEREIMEELGIVIQANRMVEYSSHIYPNKDGKSARQVILLGFLCDFISGELRPLEDTKDFAWCRAQDMIEKYDVTEADHPHVDTLIKYDFSQ